MQQHVPDVKADDEFLDYYMSYCEITIWLKKIVGHANSDSFISIKDITRDVLAERNRILMYIPGERRVKLRRKMNAIALGYFSKIANWSAPQKITINMV